MLLLEGKALLLAGLCSVERLVNLRMKLKFGSGGKEKLGDEYSLDVGDCLNLAIALLMNPYSRIICQRSGFFMTDWMERC